MKYGGAIKMERIIREIYEIMVENEMIDAGKDIEYNPQITLADMGVDSFDRMMLIYEIADKYNIKLSITKSESVQDIAKILMEKKSESGK